jgi:hypothetical protein
MPSFEMEYEEGLAIYDKAIDDAEADIIKRGLPISTRPRGINDDFARFPYMPADLSEPEFQELQMLLGQFTAWFGYAIGQLKLAEGQRNAAEKQRSFAWSSIRKLKSGTVSDKDDSVRTDRRYITIDAKYEHCDAKVRIYGAIVDGLKRDIETISRAASVLEARTDIEGRSIAVGRKGRARHAQESFRRGRRYVDEQHERAFRGLDTFRKRKVSR